MKGVQESGSVAAVQIPVEKELDEFLASKTICIVHPGHKRYKRGSVMRYLTEEFVAAGVNVTFSDREQRPDFYIFSKKVEPVLYDEIQIVMAESLIGPESLAHTYDGLTL